MGLIDEVNKIIEEDVRPYIRSHGGDVSVTEVTADSVVLLDLTGVCAGCPSADLSTKAMIEEILLSKLPEIKGVEIERKTDPALLDFARRILNKV